MKRFYKSASVAEQDGRFAVTLDGKPIRTPAKAPLVVPGRTLAEAIAGEWQAQGAEVKPAGMPITRLASIALDIVATRREPVIAEVAKYAETDLVCYRSPEADALAQRQQAIWQPLLDWASLRFDAPLGVTSGVIPLRQPAAALGAMHAAVGGYDTFELTALHAATTCCGSLVVGLALIEGRIGAEEAFAASQIDETFQIEQWGEDEIQTGRRAALKADIEAAARFLGLVRA